MIFTQIASMNKWKKELALDPKLKTDYSVSQHG